MEKFIRAFIKVEQFITGGLLCAISLLVFFSAIARTIGHPINWAQDVALLAFGWLTFLGADVLAKTGTLINIDLLVNHFPAVFQRFLKLIFDIMMLIFLAILIIYGIKLVPDSVHRMFNTLNMSYMWCTLAVPVGSSLLFLTICSRMLKHIHSFKKKDKNNIKEGQVC